MEYQDYTLDQWLIHIQKQHWRTMDLTLDRISQVWHKMQGEITGYVIVVGGTNGKGSAISMLSGVLIHAGKKTGEYTSPHLVRYNERIKIAGEEVSDEKICIAFTYIEQSRGDIPLTYFEYSTLCALYLFQRHQVDVLLLEVGMGGRLDAVNMIDNDLVLITSIGLDHEAWLGSSREVIAIEKAGIIKESGTAVCSDPLPPETLINEADKKHANLLCAERDYHIDSYGERMNWSCNWGDWGDRAALPEGWRKIEGLRCPFPGAHQISNLGGVLTALALSSEQLGLEPHILQAGLDKSRIQARCQVISGAPRIIIDVAHNQDSASELAQFMNGDGMNGDGMNGDSCEGKTIGVLGVLEDKDLAGIINPVSELIDHWCLASLQGERRQSSAALANKLKPLIGVSMIECYPNPVDAFQAAMNQAEEQDRIVIFGSFHTVGDIIGFLEEAGKLPEN